MNEEIACWSKAAQVPVLPPIPPELSLFTLVVDRDAGPPSCGLCDD